MNTPESVALAGADAARMQQRHAEDALEIPAEGGGVTLRVRIPALLQIMRALKEEEGFGYVQLSDLMAVERAGQTPKLEIVYQLLCPEPFKRLSVSVGVDTEGPPSITQLWPGADWLESEAHDRFGVEFAGRGSRPSGLRARESG